ncbi:MAG: sugar phosphate isomerase/epimerase [Clostridiales bacterium]|nr:sugar phosphate isomerase/epimerase [Clostridiales bacterium]
MKLSFMTFSTPTLTLSEVLDVAKNYGYVGVELRIAANHAHGVETTMSEKEIAEAKKTISESGILIVAIATSCSFANEVTFDKNISDAKDAIKLASALNVPVIRTFGGKYPDDTSKNKARSLLKKAYSQLAPLAKKHKVYVCFETHDMWCSPYDVAEILAYVNSEYIQVNWDIMHPITHGFTMEESFNILKPYIKHVHIHDGKGILNNKSLGLITTGQGTIDHKEAFTYLKSINYKGALSGEWISWDHYSIHLPREIKILKTLI